MSRIPRRDTGHIVNFFTSFVTNAQTNPEDIAMIFSRNQHGGNLMEETKTKAKILAVAGKGGVG